MPIIVGQATVPASSTVPAFILPPGTLCTCFYQTTPNQQVWVGTTPNVSATNGMPVPVTPLTCEQYVSSGGATLYATTGNATASSFMYILSVGSST